LREEDKKTYGTNYKNAAAVTVTQAAELKLAHKHMQRFNRLFYNM